MKLSEYLKEKSMGNVKPENEVSIDELEEQIEATKRKIKLELQKKKALKKKEEIERILANPEEAITTPKWAYVIIAILILVIIGGGGYYYLKGSDITGSVVTEMPKTEDKENTTQTVEAVIYDLGDKIKLNNISLTVESINGRDKIGKLVGTKFAGVGAEGVFYLIKISMENDGKKSIKFDYDFLIIDSEEREYSNDKTAESYYTEGKILDLDEEIKPLLLREGIKVFDVPKQSSGLKLLIKDSDVTRNIKVNLESNGKIKITNVDDKPISVNEPGPMIKVRLTDIADNDLSGDFLINKTDKFAYIYKLENLEKAILRCNVDEDINGVMTKDHQVLKLDTIEKEEFTEEIEKSNAVNYSVSYTTRCHFEGKLGETTDIKGFTAQFIN